MPNDAELKRIERDIVDAFEVDPVQQVQKIIAAQMQDALRGFIGQKRDANFPEMIQQRVTEEFKYLYGDDVEIPRINVTAVHDEIIVEIEPTPRLLPAVKGTFQI